MENPVKRSRRYILRFDRYGVNQLYLPLKTQGSPTNVRSTMHRQHQDSRVDLFLDI